MWVKGRHTQVDAQGRQVSQDITLNLARAVGYISLDKERTRVYFAVGHDLEDHRNGTWVDLNEPKSKIDEILHKSKKSPPA